MLNQRQRTLSVLHLFDKMVQIKPQVTLYYKFYLAW